MDYREKGGRRYSLAILGAVLGLIAMGLASCGKVDEPAANDTVSSGSTENAPIDAVSVRLIVDAEAIRAGQPFRIGVLLSLIPHAHVYWRNPGDSGFAIDVDWTLPEGFTVGPLQWPSPRRFYVDVIDDTSYGYENEVLLFAEVAPPESLDEDAPLQFGAKPNWLVCLDDGQCIPGGRPLELTLNGPASDAFAPDLFKDYAARMSRSVEEVSGLLKVKLALDPQALILTTVSPWQFLTDPPGPVFFPYEGDPWKLTGAVDQGATSLAFESSTDAKAAGEFVATLENSETGDVEVVSVRWGKPPIEE